MDMDGVIVNWGQSYNRELDLIGTHADNIPRHENQRSFNLHEGLTPREIALVDGVMANLNYYDMHPIAGAIPALLSMAEYGHDVMICTSPWLPNPKCMTHKMMWVQHHLGHEWSERVVITRDKTVVKGDLLIDDKPQIKGREHNPDWIHVVFDQPYNQEVTGQPRLKSWAEWKNEGFG